ncbi:MAG TPA: hypothetical protein VMS17_13535 [Gemmataceae bacterium]|nr:hypothetical protein [Gemmataceae bacterium]
MAATDKPYRNQKMLDMVFAVSCILMLASVVWMMWADFNREYKTAGRVFRDVESVIAERQMIAALPEPSLVEALFKDEQDKTKALADANAGVEKEKQRITAKRDVDTAAMQSKKADRDSIESIRNEERDAADQEGLSRSVREERLKQLAARNEQLDQLNRDLAAAQKALEDDDAEYKEKVTNPVAKAEKDLSDAQDALKKVTGNFDRFAKATVQKEWGLGDAFRSLPILDAFESPTKIKQTVLADLPIEYGSFKYVTRYDRCTTCHLGIDRTGFDHRALTKLSRSESDAREARRKAVKTAVGDIINAAGPALPPADHDHLVALEAAVDKGDVVTRIDAHGPGAPSPPPATPETTVGTATKVEKGGVTVKADDGKETAFAVPADAVVTIDGTPDKLEYIKPDSRVVVVKGDDADPFQVIGGILTKLRDPDAYGPDVVAAVSDPAIQADMVRVKEENEDFREAQALPKKLELARRILQDRKNKGENLGFEPGDMPSHVRTVGLTSGQITEFAAHPRLDLFVDSNSPHPLEKFGCSICHAGQGSATDFELAAHTPADIGEQRQWEKDYHWQATSQHDWEFPMLSSRFTESSCLQCHHEVTDLVRQGNKEEAPKLLRGFNLVRENGCFGCHEIAGLKSGREVGPDLRLEPQPALEWLTPTEQDKARSDPANPPGTYRKVGPSLRRIFEKTNEEWARRWIQSPRGFRPDTKMPHFYNLSNDSADMLPDDQKDFPPAEIHSIAHYLFHESEAGLKGEDSYRRYLEEEINELQAQLQFSPLTDKDRKALADSSRKLADLGLLSAPPHAARIDELAASLHGTQDQMLERYRRLADLEQKVAERQTKIIQLMKSDLAEDGDEDAALAKELESLTADFTKQADRSGELARKYLEEITPDEVKELAAAKDKRDKTFKALLDKAAPGLQKRLETRQKGVDEQQKVLADHKKQAADVQKELDALGKQIKDAQDRLRKAADDGAKTVAQKDVDTAKQAQEAKQKAKQDLTAQAENDQKELETRQKPLLRLQNEKKDVDQANGDLQRITGELTALNQFMDKARGDLTSQAKELIEAGRTTPMEKQLLDQAGEPVKDALPAPDKARLGEGRRIFSERGCLACHIHSSVREKADNLPALPDEAASFAPDLSRVAYKIAPKGGDAARRRWVVQWVMNPNIYHPRTRMPITHLTVQEACDVADWLLDQKTGEPTDWPEDPKTPDSKTLVALARVYLGKAPGMTAGKLEEVLPKETVDLDKAKGFSDADLKNMARDADEQVLQGKVTADKLERYIGKKSISRLGCYGCHDVPGFETAKPIGTALNDWGKKDPERLAFEDAGAYAREHYNIVDLRYDPADRNHPNPTFRTVAGKEPYEKVFYDALEHHTREGFLHQKLTEPRSFDYNRLRAWDDRLRMPQFRFARSRPRPGETSEATEAREEREEAEAREAVMTFILGLTAEPIPLKYVNTPSPDALAEAQGRKVLEKFNCIGCHQVRPGVYDIKPSKETLAALERTYQNYEANDAKKDHAFPGHNAWTGAPQWWPDRLTAHGTQGQILSDQATGRDMLSVRLTDALHFANNDGVVRNIPAGVRVTLPPEDLIDQSETFGGAFGDLLIPYLAQVDTTLFRDKPDSARAVLPPPLVREGERVQPKWLYQFLLNPGTIRPQEHWMRLRMPKFNMSPDEAMALVNYFGSTDKRSNPGAGLTTPYLRIEQNDAQYWRDANEEYLKRLSAGAQDAKAQDQRAKDLLTDLKTGVQQKIDALNAAAATAQGADKDRLTKEAADLKAVIDKWDKQIASNDFTDLKNQWKSDDAYSADAYRLVTANPSICTKCHNVGAVKAAVPQGPDLGHVWERLRPEWTQQWIGNPERMFSYAPTMPQNFPNDKADYTQYLAGSPRDRVRAARDVLMDLPRLEALPANRATRAEITGGKGP